MQYITINGQSIPYPNDFTLQKVPNVVNEMQTLTGKTVADINGWKYADTTLSWDTLLDQDLQNLLAAIEDNEFTMTFIDLDGATHTVNAIFRGRANVKTPIFQNSTTVWKDISVDISFPDCYED